VVLTDVPVGHGNLPNVEVALEAARAGKPVVALRPELIGDRDFTEGKAAELVGLLLSTGITSASTVDEVVRAVEAIQI
jgi:iron complex transport system ATP-binding protein